MKFVYIKKKNKWNVSKNNVDDLNVNVLTSTYLAVKLDVEPSSLIVDVLALLDASLVEVIIAVVPFLESKMTKFIKFSLIKAFKFSTHFVSKRIFRIQVIEKFKTRFHSV